MDGCTGCCSKFLNFVTCGILGSPTVPPTLSQSQLVASVSSGFNAPLPIADAPPSVVLANRYIVTNIDRRDTLSAVFD